MLLSSRLPPTNFRRDVRRFLVEINNAREIISASWPWHQQNAPCIAITILRRMGNKKQDEKKFRLVLGLRKSDVRVGSTF
jgi:hypothetical protein